MHTKLFTRILNFLGLTLAVATFAIIMVQVEWDVTYNKAYPDADRLYRVELNQTNDGEFWPATARPIIESIRKNCAHDGMAETLMLLQQVRVRTSADPKATSFAANELQATSEAFSLFGMEIVQGQVDDFDDQTSIAITTTLAERLFPGQSAIGKTIFLQANDATVDMKIIAVYKPLARNVMFAPDIMKTLGDENKEEMSEWSYCCFLKRPEAMPEAQLKSNVHKAISTAITRLMPEAMKMDSSQVRLTKLHDIHFTPISGGDSADKASLGTLITLITLAAIVLIVAIVNFLNISMAAIPRHIREINTRKIFGSSRMALIWRQLREAIVIAVLAVVAAALLMEWISTTQFASFVSDTIEPLEHVEMMLMILASAVVVGIVAGVYPAIYSTSFQPAVVLKGSFSHSASGRRLRWVLVGAQLVMSMVLMLFALFVGVQTRYMESHDKGFQSEAILTSRLEGQTPLKNAEIKQRLLKNPQIADVTFADGNLVNAQGTSMSWGRAYKGEQIVYGCLPVSTNFLDFFGIKMAQGRAFRESDNNVDTGAYIFNEVAAKKFGLSVGQRMGGHNGDAEIVGIARNFNFRPLQYGIEPMALYSFGSTPWRPLSVMYVKMAKNADYGEVKKLIEQEQMGADADLTADNIKVEFLDEYIGQLYQKEQSLGEIITVACIVSVLISVIGILGLVYLETQFRRKEIALRRVVGASIGEILRMFTSIYAKICGLCFVVSVPIAYAIIRTWLKNYPYQSPIPVWIFVATLAATLLIVALTVSLTSLKAAMRNPVESIKTE